MVEAEKISLQTTEDGSPTLYSQAFGEHYHSIHGAVQESQHIFIALGFRHWQELHPTLTRCTVLEFGFGTGLNALLTASEAGSLSVLYHSLEKYPIPADVYSRLHYAPFREDLLKLMHQAEWGQSVAICSGFDLHKIHADFTNTSLPQAIDLIYFDAFSPETCPEQWTEDLFRSIFDVANEGAVLTTYCAKGEVRRRLQRAGWQVERLPGPPGKREVLRAVK